ncbi:MAG TPA: serine/threonine protein kinase [Vicinamibacteria bacterium]|nr:serine/threonine protein kinase [Vicinamibacteria bacterium]
MKTTRAGPIPAWAWPLLALPVVAALGFWTYRAVDKALRAQIRSALRNAATSDTSALRQWLQAQAGLASVVTADPRVRDDVASLLALARRTGGDPAALKAAPEQARLREIIGPILEQEANAGFIVFDPNGLLVARIVDERVGDRATLGVADAVARAMDGKPVFLAPTLKQRFAEVPMAFLMVPMRDASGRPYAVFAFRILPQRMAEVLNATPLDANGQTYAIDSEGRMVTESRFADEAERLGLLPPEAGGRTTAALEVRDPGARLEPGLAPRSPQKTWPFTWAVADVVAGRAGVNADGYRDFRGVEVVGAWEWQPEWGIGVVTEIPRDDAYATLALVRRSFRGLALALLLLAAGMAFASRRIYGLQKDVQKAERLGQYTLEEKVGEGGMGSVYRARHAFLRRPTAIKLILGEGASPETLARFEREVQLTSQLTHPNTIAIYDYGRTPEGIFYYAMEYLPGLPLDYVINGDGPQPEPRVVHILKQICASLAEAHRTGLVHRDVKPANVMLCERGGTYDVVKVLDFGLVKELRSEDDAALTSVGHVVGTPLYMAPEVVTAPTLVGPRSDVYAVGAIAYGLITGQHVFEGKSSPEIVAHHLHTAPMLPSERLGREVAPFLERLTLACLAKKPDDRPADAGTLLALLEEEWTGPSWTQREARAWWETRAPEMLAYRRAQQASVSRGPRLEVDVSSRMRSGSLPELSLDEALQTSARPKDDPPPPAVSG